MAQTLVHIDMYVMVSCVWGTEYKAGVKINAFYVIYYFANKTILSLRSLIILQIIYMKQVVNDHTVYNT